MKSFFKSLMIICFFIFGFFQKAIAREVVSISYSNIKQERLAQLVYKIIVNRLQIPSKLIELKKTPHGCAPLENRFLHICTESEIQISFPISKQEQLKRTFSVLLGDSSENE